MTHFDKGNDIDHALRSASSYVGTASFQENIRSAISFPNLIVSHCFSSSVSEGERTAFASGKHNVKCFKGI